MFTSLNHCALIMRAAHFCSTLSQGFLASPGCFTHLQGVYFGERVIDVHLIKLCISTSILFGVCSTHSHLSVSVCLCIVDHVYIFNGRRKQSALWTLQCREALINSGHLDYSKCSRLQGKRIDFVYASKRTIYLSVRNTSGTLAYLLHAS